MALIRRLSVLTRCLTISSLTNEEDTALSPPHSARRLTFDAQLNGRARSAALVVDGRADVAAGRRPRQIPDHQTARVDGDLVTGAGPQRWTQRHALRA